MTMDDINSIFKLEGKPFSLNHNSMKKLQVCIVKIYPEVEFIIKIISVHHCYHVEFSLDNWIEILRKQQEIRTAIENAQETLIFRNNDLKVFTERINLHNIRSLVSFLDYRGVKVTMKSETFNNMMKLSQDIQSSFADLGRAVRKLAETHKLCIYATVTMKFDRNMRQICCGL